MAALLLTPANLDAAKAALRASVPGLKSAHASETLAWACGYRTHAALLADLKASPVQFPPLARLSEDRLAQRVRDFGVEAAPQIVKILARGALPDPIWRAFPRTEKAANDNWFYACQRRNIPFVYLHVGRKYWRLNWDCISTDHSYDRHVRGDAGDDLMRALFRQFQARARQDPKKAIFEGTGFVGEVEGLLPETARDLADDFFTMLYTPIREG